MSINSIVIPHSPHPVLDDKTSACPNYQPLNLKIWGPNSTAALPCTVDLADTKLQQILVYITLPEGYEGELKLIGVLEDAAIPIVEESPQNPTLSNDGSCFALTLVAPCRQAPWGYRGRVKWTLKNLSNETEVGVTPLEIYGISSYLPPYFERKGVYAGFLQYIVPTNSTKMKDFTDYTKHVVDCAFRSGYYYDRWYGEEKYAHLTWKVPDTDKGEKGYDREVKGSFKLRKWVVNQKLTNERNQYHCNCYDQSGISQLGLSLGILNEDQEKLLVTHYLKPYGFINTAHLVGSPDKPCNSPYRSHWNPEILDVQDEHRTYFTNHAFLIYNKIVLDATCRPIDQPDAQPSLEEYLATAIDRNDNLHYYRQWYNSEKDIPDDIKEKIKAGDPSVQVDGDTVKEADEKFNGHPHGGTIEDMGAGGPGVIQLFGDAKIEDYLDTRGESKHEHTSIQFHELSNKLSSAPQLSGWTVELVSDPTPVEGATAMEWSLRPNFDDRADLDIYYYTTETGADAAYNAYVEKMNSYTTHLIDASKDEAKGQKHVVGTNSKKGFQMWIAGRIFVKLSGLKNSAALKPVVDVLGEYLAQKDATPFKCCSPATLTSLESVTASEGTARRFKKNSKFEAKVSAPGAIIGNVHNTAGNVILLESQKGDDMFTFRFVARHVGSETIAISFVDPSCDPCCAQKVDFTVEVYD